MTGGGLYGELYILGFPALCWLGRMGIALRAFALLSLRFERSLVTSDEASDGLLLGLSGAVKFPADGLVGLECLLS